MSIPLPQLDEHGREWFERPDAPEGGAGLRFGCTMCGNCCSGPSGFVLVSDAEIAALARRFAITPEQFIDTYTHMLPEGRSLREVDGPARSDQQPGQSAARGYDCVFLDRQRIPGKAVCGVYEDRPAQCRTWPYWRSVIRSPQTWAKARAICPGINSGTLTPPDEIKRLRAVVEI